jgi:hypothetical protein
MAIIFWHRDTDRMPEFGNWMRLPKKPATCGYALLAAASFMRNRGRGISGSSSSRLSVGEYTLCWTNGTGFVLDGILCLGRGHHGPKALSAQRPACGTKAHQLLQVG